MKNGVEMQAYQMVKFGGYNQVLKNFLKKKFAKKFQIKKLYVYYINECLFIALIIDII